MSTGTHSGSPLPARPGRVYFGAAAIVGGIFVSTWTYLNWKEKRKSNRAEDHPGGVPAWEQRLALAAHPVRYSGNERTLLRNDLDERRSNAANSGPSIRDNNVDQHVVAGVRIGDIKRDDQGGPMHPTPQREHPHGDGVAYPKKVDGPIPLAENSPKMKGQNAEEASMS